MSEDFDFNAALAALQGGKSLTGKDGVLAPLIKQLTEAALQGELDAHLSDSSGQNRRNGYSRKRVQSASGSFDLETPRDREGSFEPQLVKRHQRHLTPHA